MSTQTTESEFARKLELLQKQRVDALRQEFGDATLFLLCIFPSWLEELLKKFVAELDLQTNIESILERAVRQRLLQVQNLWKNGQHVREYTVPTELRYRIVAELGSLAGPQSYLNQLLSTNPKKARIKLQELTSIAKSIDSASSRFVEIWAHLVLANPWGETPDNYEKFIVQAMDEELGQNGLSASHYWVSVLQDVALIGPAYIADIIPRLKRRLTQSYLLEQDKRRLTEFVEPSEHVETLAKLLNPKEKLWCVHFLGSGGVGKTMLMRWLTVYGQQRFKYKVARIDFDFLSPEYPLQNPGELLSAMMEQLLVHVDSSRREYLYNRWKEQIGKLNTQAASGNWKDRPHQIVDTPGFQLAMQVFMDLLKSLDNVLMIFDTVEELAKLHTSGTNLPSLEVTLILIERMYAANNRLKIIFAGRRPLAKSGGSEKGLLPWKATSSERLPGHKEYMAVCPIYGFTQGDASRLFDRLEEKRQQDASPNKPGTLRVLTPFQRSAIIAECKNSMETSVVMEPARSESAYYNPFELFLIANWVLDEGDQALEQLKASNFDIYVQRRIVDRLEPELQPIVPVVVLLRRFDKQTLDVACGASHSQRDVFRVLAEQEWIHTSREGDEEILTVDRNLLPRLERFYEHSLVWSPDRASEIGFAELGRLVAERIVTMVVEDAPESASEGSQAPSIFAGQRLDRHMVDLVLRWHDTLEAKLFWDHVCLGLADHAAWQRLNDIAAYVLGSEGAVGQQPNHSLKPFVMSAMLNVHTYTGTPAALAAEWRSILAAVPEDSELDQVRWVHRRALLGLSETPAIDLLAEILVKVNWDCDVLSQRKLQQLLASLLASLARQLDARESEEDGPLPVQSLTDLQMTMLMTGLLNRVESLTPTPSGMRTGPALAWYVLGLDARMYKREDEFLEYSTAIDSTQRWIDLVLPDDVVAYARLEKLRTRRSRPTKVDEPPTLRKLAQAYDLNLQQAQHNNDREYLLSAALLLALDYRVVPVADLKTLATIYGETPPFTHRCLAHRKTPPIQASIAQGLAAAGLASEAIQFVDQYISQWRSKLNESVRNALFRVRLDIARQYRMMHELSSIDAHFANEQLQNTVLAAYLVTLPIRPSVEARYAAQIVRLQNQRLLEQDEELPPRRMAERYLEAAELTQDYKAATRYIDTAITQFKVAQDHFGHLRAFTMRHLKAPAGDRVFGIGVVYEKCLGIASDSEILPPWIVLFKKYSALKAAMQTSKRLTEADESLQEFLDKYRSMSGWLLRILICMLSNESPSLLKKEKLWIYMQQRSDNWPREIEALIQKKNLVPGILLVVLQLAIGLIVWAGIIYGGYRGIVYLSTVELPQAVKITGSVLGTAVLGLLSLTGLGVLAVALLSSLRIFRNHYRMRADLNSLVSDDFGNKATTITLTERRWAVIFVGKNSKALRTNSLDHFFELLGVRLGMRLGLVDLDSTRVSSDLSPINLTSMLESWLKSNDSILRAQAQAILWDWVIEVEVGRALAYLPWEKSFREVTKATNSDDRQELADHSRNEQKSNSSSNRAARLPLVLRTGAPMDIPAEPITKVLLPQTHGAIRAPLKELKVIEAVELENALGSRDTTPNSAAQASPTALVFCAIADEDSGGVYLQAKPLPSSKWSNAENTISAEQIANAKPSLVVLIGESTPYFTLTVTDRLQCAHLRSMAAEIFELSVPCVVALPAMPPSLWSHVLNVLSEAVIGRRPWKVGDAVLLAKALRKAVLYGKDFERFDIDALSNREGDSQPWAYKLDVSQELLRDVADEICVYTRSSYRGFGAS